MSISCDGLPGRRPFKFGLSPLACRCTIHSFSNDWVRRSRPACLVAGYDALHTALQLQQDDSLMSSNVTVLHQYAISLHRTASEMLHSVLGREFFPSTAVNDAAPVPRILHVLAHLAAMGLWRPPVGPGGPGLYTVHQGPQYSGCPLWHLRPSGW